MMKYETNAQTVSTSAPQSANQSETANGLILGGVVIAIPLLVTLGVLAYRKHRTYRQQRRIAMLERLWLLDSPKRTP